MKNINNKIEKFIIKEYEETIKDYIKRFLEYRNIKLDHDFKFIVEFMRELITEGDTKYSYCILSESDEYDFNLYDRLQSLSNETKDINTSNLIDFIELTKDNEVYKICSDDYFENEYLTEDLHYIFDLDKDLYKGDIFYYYTSHQGTLYFNRFYIDKLDLQYIVNQEELEEVLYNYDIKQLWVNFLFHHYRDSFKIEMPSRDLKDIEEECLEAVKEELNKRLTDNTINLNLLNKELQEIKTPLLKDIGESEILSLEREIKEIKEVLK